MLFVFRVNFAISALGIKSTLVDQKFRIQMIVAGKAAGNSPQEVALWIVSQLPLRIRCDYNAQTVKGWIRARKVNPQDIEMQTALFELGYY